MAPRMQFYQRNKDILSRGQVPGSNCVEFGCFSSCLREVSSDIPASPALIGASKLPAGVNVSMNDCLLLCVYPVFD